MLGGARLVAWLAVCVRVQRDADTRVPELRRLPSSELHIVVRQRSVSSARVSSHRYTVPSTQHLPIAASTTCLLLHLLSVAPLTLVMQRAVVPPSPRHTVFHSADLSRLIAACLPINDLLTASTLCRASSVFDSDGIWQRRLEEVERIQHVEDDATVSAVATLSPAQLAALPPLPTLSRAAAICLRAYVDVSARPFVNSTTWQPPRLAAIVHLPSTLCYHARIVLRTGDRHPLDNVVTCPEFTLTTGDSGTWQVEKLGKHDIGWRALLVDDNIGLDEQHSDDQLPHSPAASGSSSKQRYIDLLQCSEHEHRQCWRLLPPSPPRGVGGVSFLHTVRPRLCPLPLCASCTAVIARCIARRPSVTGVVSVTRLNLTTYDVIVLASGWLNGCREIVAHTNTATEETGSHKDGHELT